MRIVGIGHSHIICVRHAAAVAKLTLDRLGVSVETVWVGDPKFHPYRIRDDAAGIDGFQLAPDIRDSIVGAVEGADSVFLCSGGNAHNIFGLVNHPRPFDFVLKTNPGLPLHPGYEVIPSGIVDAALVNQGGFPESIWVIKALKALISKPLVQCESPPPVPSTHYIGENAGPFYEKILQYGVTPAPIRYKLWRLHSELLQRECKALNVGFISGPSSMIDGHGFLVERGWNNDATHANQHYGKKIIEQIVQLTVPSFGMPETV